MEASFPSAPLVVEERLMTQFKLLISEQDKLGALRKPKNLSRTLPRRLWIDPVPLVPSYLMLQQTLTQEIHGIGS